MYFLISSKNLLFVVHIKKSRNRETKKNEFYTSYNRRE